MGYAYSALVPLTTPKDGDGDWQPDFPWPEPWPWPPPPYPPGVDPDPLPPDDPDYDPEEKGTWRYRHIVKSINARRYLHGLGSSGLPVNKIDAHITYQNINDARSAIEALMGYMARNIEGRFYRTFNMFYQTRAELLTDIGLHWSGTWRNLKAGGEIWYASDTMAATDLVVPVMFYDMERALKALVHTEGANQEHINDHHTWGIGGSTGYATQQLAWANRYTSGGSKNEHACFWVASTKGADPTKYLMFVYNPNFSNLSPDVSVTASTSIVSSNSRKFKLYDYGHWDKDADKMYDVTGSGLTMYYRLRDSETTTATSATLYAGFSSKPTQDTWVAPPCLGSCDTSANYNFTNGSFQYGFEKYKTQTMTEWIFTEDDKLGSWEA